MIYDNQLIKEINSELAARRKAAESRAEYYADILGKNAGYAAAEKKYYTAKFDLSKARFNGNEAAEEKSRVGYERGKRNDEIDSRNTRNYR